MVGLLKDWISSPIGFNKSIFTPVLSFRQFQKFDLENALKQKAVLSLRAQRPVREQFATKAANSSSNDKAVCHVLITWV